MIKLLPILMFAFCCNLCFSQKSNPIQIIQKKTKRKIELFAVNSAQKDKSFSVQLNGVGFRRKVFKPIQIKIKANDTIALTTLYKLRKGPHAITYKLFSEEKIAQK